MSKGEMKSENRLILSFVLNFFFTIFELIGGFITGSMALLSDAVHDLGDSISIGIAIILEKKSKKKPDKIYTYGYRRFSLLGGLISSLILIIGSTLIIYKSIERLIDPEPLTNPKLLIVFAIIGVIVNGLAAYNAAKGKTINEKVISLHLLEDVFGWVAILISSILIVLFKIPILDTMLSLVFSVYILIHVIKNLKRIIEVFLEKAPLNPKISLIKSKLIDIEGVLSIHHIHLWTLEGSVPLMTLHLSVDQNIDLKRIIDIQSQAHQILHQMGINHATIQIEVDGIECYGKQCEELQSDVHHHHH